MKDEIQESRPRESAANRRERRIKAAAERRCNAPNALYTVDELADHWNCSRASIYRALQSGKLKAVKVGGMTRFRPADVLAAEQAA